MKNKRHQLIAGVALAIPNLWHLFTDLKNPNRDRADGERARCKLCGQEMRTGGGQIAHGNAHVRRHELEEVTVDGWTETDGEKASGWRGVGIGYRTSGHPGFYVVEIIERGDNVHHYRTGLPYDRGEMPRFETLFATEHDAKHAAHSLRASGNFAVRALIDPPSRSNTSKIEARVRAAFLSCHRWAATKDVTVDTMFVAGNWTVTTTRTTYPEYPTTPKVDEQIFDVEDASDAHAIDVFDGFRFIELGP